MLLPEAMARCANSATPRKPSSSLWSLERRQPDGAFDHVLPEQLKPARLGRELSLSTALRLKFLDHWPAPR